MTIQISDVEQIRDSLYEQLAELDQLVLAMEFSAERNRATVIRNSISDLYLSTKLLINIESDAD